MTDPDLNPYELRHCGVDRPDGPAEPLAPWAIGRALYHIAKRRHFRSRDFAEGNAAEQTEAEAAAEEAEASSAREATAKALAVSGQTLGSWLAGRPGHQRKRGVHAERRHVEEEFDRFWRAQAMHCPLLTDDLRETVSQIAFHQRPVFWRPSTLGECPLEPGATLAPRASWISQQRRMLEKLNNLAIAGGNGRPLLADERDAILEKLSRQASMTWGGVRKALDPLFRARGESTRLIKFNLELGGESGLIGNRLEASLAEIFGEAWSAHPQQDTIRREVPARLWAADYKMIGNNRIVIRPDRERQIERERAQRSFIVDFGATEEEATRLGGLHLGAGWEPYSIAALERILPKLSAGHRFGELLNSPTFEPWREHTFPNRRRPTGEFVDRLPSPQTREEGRRLASLRNPTVVRCQNELRKVVNNLIGAHGKPDLIRVELAREVGKSKREREEMKSGIRKQEGRRKKAAEDLKSKGIADPSRADIEKWLLWQETRERCPYTGDQIGFDALFRRGEFEVEHIWPLPRSLDDSFANKTLCRKDVNAEKGNRTPYEAFHHQTERWAAICERLNGLIGRDGMSPGKVRRFVAPEIPDGFVARQLNDTGYAARQAVAFLKRLWPDAGPTAPVTVQAVGGRVTAQLRRLWGLNNILSDDGEKTRADHRHHAIDALAVACASPAHVKHLSDHFANRRADPRTRLPAPWAAIRADATAEVQKIVVSHRVRKKVSGPLHMDTFYGDTGEDVTTRSGVFRRFVSRKAVEQLAAAVDSLVGNVVGAGIKPQSTHPDRAVRERLQALWLRWTDHAAPDGLADFYGLQAMAVRAMVESGESFGRLRVASDASTIPLHLELLDREQVPMDLHREIGGGARIRAGIEFDSVGCRVAYRVLSSRPGDPLGSLRMDPLRVPAADCLHLFKPLAAGQLRGITWLAPVLLRLHELDQFEDAALVKAKVAALFTGFITDPDGTAGGLSGTNTGGALTVGMEPGSLIPLPPGTDIRFSNPTEHDAYAPFVKNHLRAVAAGLGLPYELVSGDLEGVTYSSIRAGLIEFRRRVEQLQHNVVVHLFCRPVWKRFVRLAVLTGELPARDFDRNPDAYLGCEWLPPKFDYVDPMKDVQAEIMAIGAGLKSRSQAISERGYDAEQVDAEIAADRERAEGLGLTFGQTAAAQHKEAADG